MILKPVRRPACDCMPRLYGPTGAPEASSACSFRFRVGTSASAAADNLRAMTTAPRTPTQLADDAAEAIRALNHATLSARDGWTYPGDAYSTVANLADMARKLPQAPGQLEGFVGAMEDAGRLQSDTGPDDLPGRLLDFHRAMAGAITQSRALGQALDRAHQALGPVGYRE